MTINETIKLNKSIDGFLLLYIKPAFEKAMREYAEQVQPKTTSTDIEELKKEFNKQFTDGYGFTHQDYRLRDGGSTLIKDIWNFFLPHLSNKSGLKKEAVREEKE